MGQLQRVTKEQAVKLKEAGFDWECKHIYFLNGHNDSDIMSYNNHNTGKNSWSSPPLALACKFMRDIISIDIEVHKDTPIGKYVYKIISKDRVLWSSSIYPTYEAAQSAGLDVALDFKK